MTVGLVTASLPFAGLAENPAAAILPPDGSTVAGTTIRTLLVEPVLATVPARLAAAIATHRPAFVLSLGLALGSPVLRLETTAINRLAFAVADNAGVRPVDGRLMDPAGPPARLATWDFAAIVAALLADGLPAVASHFAGTHLCNATLYSVLGATAVPAGFLHLPYLPEQVAQFLAAAPAAGDRAPTTPRDLPSMSAENQRRALAIVIQKLAMQANA